MDRTDVVLSLVLLQGSRVPYRQLAGKLGLSVNAVHKRIQSLVEAGVIRAFRTRLSLASTGALNVWYFGPCDSPDVERIKAGLQRDRDAYWVALTGADYLLVGAYLHSLAELDENMKLVVEQCGMRAPFVGITAFPSLPEGADLHMGLVDLRIVRSLSYDSRKSVAQVAEETSLSAKTVRRRLERMEKLGLIEYSIDWYPDESNDIMTLLHVRLHPGEDKHKVGMGLVSRY